MKQCTFYLTVLICCFTLAHTDSNYDNYNGSPFINNINSLQSDWQAEENEYSHLETNELKRMMGLKIDTEGHSNQYYKKDIVLNNIPDEFDARKQWRKCRSIRDVKDQSNCGSCWAVSTASAMSDRFCIASKSKDRSYLSAEALLTCCSTCSGGGPGCGGGYLLEAWKYCKWHGLVTGGNYGSKQGCQPYSIKPCQNCSSEAVAPACEKKKCTNKAYKKSYKSDLHNNKNFYLVRSNVSVIQSEILRFGPVVTGFTVYRDFMSYKSGVYRHVTGENLGNHAVRVIGWGVEKRKGKRIPYWLAVNSWSKSWGDKGLFKILQANNGCRFEKSVVAGKPRIR